MNENKNTLPIGVFDSGVGGLTVLRALQRHMPHEHFLYLGDTARLPYGTKSGDSVIRYSHQAAALLVARGIKCLVVACNTASATALGALQQHYTTLPVLGVVEPGAVAGCMASRSGRIAVIATEGTVQGGAYQQAILRVRSDAQVAAVACPLFVALAEEGWTQGPVVEAIARHYLDPIFANTSVTSPDTLLLGCTHFPVLYAALRAVVGAEVTIVDSAATTALALKEMLSHTGLINHAQQLGGVTFLATDGPERFARVGLRFLDHSLQAAQVELVDLNAVHVR